MKTSQHCLYFIDNKTKSCSLLCHQGSCKELFDRQSYRIYSFTVGGDPTSKGALSCNNQIDAKLWMNSHISMKL